MTSVAADENLDDLYERLVNLLYSVPAIKRQAAYWAMSREWHDRLVNYAETVLHAFVPVHPTELLGLPIAINDDGGFPLLMIPDDSQ